MKLKPAFFLFLIVISTGFFSACTKVESETSEEVVIEDKTNGSREEVVITTADTKKDENEQIPTSQPTSQLPKRLLADKSEIVTLIDGYGNKTETRYFPGNTRIRYVSLRTSVDGTREVTVYGANGMAKIMPELGDDAMTLSGDQLAGSAQLSADSTSPVIRNYLKRGKTESQTPLQPLPSSAFQQPPTVQYTQPVEPAEPQTNSNNENPAQPGNPEED